MAKNAINLENRTAIVTGGAQGIGRAIVERLVESGARCMIWDQDSALAEQTASEIGNGTLWTAVDVSDADSVGAATEQAAEAMERIDILVTSAGVAGLNAPVWEYPVEEWKRVHAINLDGTFLCARAVVPVMRKNNYGRIVFIASVAGKEGNPTASSYSSSKAGVMALTKSLGKELAGEDIAVNCVTPAAAKTRIFEQVTQEHIDYMLAKIPRGRFLKIEEAAAMVAWLVSEDNSFTTGAAFDLSGGRATY